ncbi:MAG: B12-binding domain-containing radical SAM protein, partial [Armatimonadota bacterium]
MSHGTVVLVNTNVMRPVVAPIGLDYVGASLAESGWDVELIDLALEENAEEAIRGRLADTSPVAVGVTIRNTDDCFFASRHSCLPRIAQFVGLIKRNTDAPIVLGGAGFSVMPAALLERLDLELGIWGEGEVAFVRLLDSLARDLPLAHVPGLVWRGGRGPLTMRDGFARLAELPLSRRELLDNGRYFREGGQGGFETKRGCDRRCIYCADPVSKGREVRVRPPASVADEVDSLLAQGVTHLHTCDSEFNIPPDHAKAVCRALISGRLGDRVAWYAYCAPAPFDAELAALMRRAGCVGINFGVDSGCEAMLRTYARDFGKDDVAAAAGLCKKNGIVF